VVLAALTNALRVVRKDLADVRVVMSGAGAAGTAILRLLLESGVRDVVVADVEGVVHRDRPGLDQSLHWVADATNRAGLTGSLHEAMDGADVFVGVSAPNVIDGGDVARMADDAIVFALANPVPEIDPAVARRHAAVVATGRSDYPNQINNVLAFPGVFRGLLDAAAHTIDDSLLVAAAEAIASTVTAEELNANYIIPSVFHADVHTAVAAAVRSAAERSTKVPTTDV
jgi:malate dehydrogenase (oxaloacetate-decarboxylating)